MSNASKVAVTTSQRKSLIRAIVSRFGPIGVGFEYRLAVLTPHTVRITDTENESWLEGNFAGSRMVVVAEHDALAEAPAPVAMVAQPVQQQQAKAHSERGWFMAECVNVASAPYLTLGKVYRLREGRNGWYETEGGDRMAHFRFKRLDEKTAVEPEADKPEAWEAQARAAGWIQLIGGAWAGPGSAIAADRRLVQK